MYYENVSMCVLLTTINEVMVPILFAFILVTELE